MNPPRRVESEWLDALPANDPRAIRSRRDLRRMNAWMLQTGIMARALIEQCASERPRTLIDLGAGDGTFMLAVARQLAPRWQDVAVILLDQQDIVSENTRAGFRALQWQIETVAMDVFDFLERLSPASVDVITANLFLHHFQQAQLARLLAQVARSTRLFVACEPRRAFLALLGSKMVWALGCNDVSRHDAVASVRAGFDGRELSDLWPGPSGWQLQEGGAWLFTHRFTARRA
jgi:SAM-dependent methyltransferase